MGRREREESVFAGLPAIPLPLTHPTHSTPQTEGDDPESTTNSDSSEPAARGSDWWSPSSAGGAAAPAAPSLDGGGPLSQGVSRLPGGAGGPGVALPAYGLHGPSRLGRTASIQLPPPLAAALAASSAAADDEAPPPSTTTTAPGVPFSLAHARSASEAVLARTFSSRGAGAALLGAARSDLPPGGLARCVSDAAAMAAAAAAAAEYEAAGDDWDLAALATVSLDTAGDDGRSVREGLTPPPPACCSYAALHGASVGDCGCCKGGGDGAPTVALTVDAAPRSRAPPPGVSASASSQGPLAALEDIHDIVCATMWTRAPSLSCARRPPRLRRRATAGCARRAAAPRPGVATLAPPTRPPRMARCPLTRMGGAWGSPTGRVRVV